MANPVENRQPSSSNSDRNPAPEQSMNSVAQTRLGDYIQRSGKMICARGIRRADVKDGGCCCWGRGKKVLVVKYVEPKVATEKSP